MAVLGDNLVTVSSRPVVKVWSIGESKVEEVGKMSHGAVGSSCVEAAPHGDLVATCADDGAIILFDVRQQRHVLSLESDELSAFRVKFLPGDSNRLISGGSSGTISFWDIRRSSCIHQLRPPPQTKHEGQRRPEVKRRKRELDEEQKVEGNNHAQAESGGSQSSSPVYSLTTSRDGKWVACGCGQGELGVLRLQDRTWLDHVKAHLGCGAVPVRCVEFDAQSHILLSGGDDHHLSLLDVRALAKLRSEDSRPPPQMTERFVAHRSWVTSVRCCPDVRRPVAVSTAWDGSVKLWDFRTHGLLKSYQEHSEGVYSSIFAPDGGFFVTVGADARIVLYVAKHEEEPSKAEGALVPYGAG